MRATTRPSCGGEHVCIRARVVRLTGSDAQQGESFQDLIHHATDPITPAGNTVHNTHCYGKQSFNSDSQMQLHHPKIPRGRTDKGAPAMGGAAAEKLYFTNNTHVQFTYNIRIYCMGIYMPSSYSYGSLFMHVISVGGNALQIT